MRSLLSLLLCAALVFPWAADAATLRVITDDNYPPYLFRNPDGVAEGYLVDLWALFEKKTGIKVELVATRWVEAQKRILAGDADVIDMIYRTPAREPNYSFSAPYDTLPVALFVDRGIRGIHDLGSLKGFKVGVQEGDACIEHLQQAGVASLQRYGNYAALIKGALANEVKVFCLDEYPANYYLYLLDPERRYSRAFYVYEGQFHRAVRKGDLATLQTVEQGMAQITEGERAALKAKWFVSPKQPYLRYAGYALLVFVLVILFMAAWIWTIRRAVRLKTEAVQKSEENLSRAQAVARIGSWHLDIATNSLSWSDETYRLFGIPQNTPITLADFFDHIHPDDRELVSASWDSAVTTGMRYEVEHRIVANGETLWVRELGEVEPDRDGRPCHGIGTVQDITADKKNRDALDYANQCFTQALNSPHHILYRLNVKEGRYDYLSSSFETITGYPVAEFKKNSLEQLAEYFHPDDRRRVFSIIDEAVRTRTAATVSLELEYRLRKADGEYCWFHDFTAAGFDDAGELECFYGSAHDITVRKQYEAEITRFQEIVQSSDDAIIGKTLDGIVTSWNPGAEKIFGYGAAEMIGRPMTFLFPPELIGEEQAILAKIAQGESVHHYMSRRIRKDGSLIDVSVTISPILDGEGRIVGASKIARDISARVERERELEQARKAAEAGNRAKSEFLATMSHEIRTPMNGIMGMAQILEYTPLNEEQRECVDVIKKSSGNLLAIINDILDLSKIEAGKMELSRREFSLRDTVNEVIKTQIPVITAKRLGIDTIIPTSVPDLLSGDQLRLKQILLNLVGNAIKFTEKGGIHIRATIREQGDQHILLTLEVADTGIGIAPEHLEHIFKPFTQVDSSDTRRYGGTGLGLTVCTRLTNIMGGRIWVESREGAGSSFFVELPFGKVEAGAERHNRRAGDRAFPRWDGPSLRVLLVEDEEINALFTSNILKKAGHTITWVRDGREALTHWEGEPFDLVLMDVQMPVMDGIEATVAIRERERATGGHIPIIALTARALHEERTFIQSQWFDGYISKPYEIGEMFAEMKRCLGVSVP